MDTQPQTKDICDVLEICAQESESGRNFARTPHACREAAKEIDDLRHKLRMIISHASGGHSQDIDLTTNQIAVGITRHVNRVWERAKEVGAEETLAKLKDLPEDTADEMVRKFKLERLDLDAEDFQDIAACLANQLS